MSSQRAGAVSLASLAILWSATHVALDARQTAPPAHDVIVLSAPGDLPWKGGATQGLEQAALWGDRERGPHATMSRYPPGFSLRPHFHTHAMRGVIVSGTWLLGIVDGTTATLPAGSYFSLPGRTAHTDRCEGPAPCVLFLTQDDVRDTVYLDSASGR